MFLEIPPEIQDDEGGLETTEGAEVEGEENGGALDAGASRDRETALTLEEERARPTERNAELTEQNAELMEEVSGLKGSLEAEKGKYRALWQMNCQQLTEYATS